MSYDIYLRPVHRSPCPLCERPFDDESPDLPNPTFNLAPIFDRALVSQEVPSETSRDDHWSLRRLSGRIARDTITELRGAIVYLQAPENQEALIALEPPNKWGTLSVAIKVLETLLAAAEKFPDSVWEIH